MSCEKRSARVREAYIPVGCVDAKVSAPLLLKANAVILEGKSLVKRERDDDRIIKLRRWSYPGKMALHVTNFGISVTAMLEVS